MRRPPKSRHISAVIILLAVSVLTGLHAWFQPEPSARQLRTAAIVVAQDNPQAFTRDPLTGNERIKKLDNPLWTWFTGQMRIAADDDFDISLWFAPLAGPLTAIYLIGMYGLLWKQSRSWKAACTAAILSLVVIEPVNSTPWGMGPLHIISPETVVVAFIPMAAWLLWIDRPRPALLWGFVGIGVLGNFDFATAITLAAALIATRLFRKLPTGRELSSCVLALLAVIAAASPMLLNWASAANGENPGAFDSVAAAMVLNGPTIHKSSTSMIMGLFELPSLIRLLALIIPGVIAAIGFERFKTPNRRLWFTLSISCISLAAIFIILSNTIKPANSLLLLLAANTIRMVMLSVYVLFTQAMVNFSRSGLRHAICWVFVLFSLCWLIPSDNLSWPRHKIEYFAASFMPEQSKPRNVLNRQSRLERQRELIAIGQWLRANTATDSVIASSESELRVYAARPLIGTDDDLKALSVIGADSKQLRQVLTEQRNLISPTDDKLQAGELEKFLIDNGAKAAAVNAWAIDTDTTDPKYLPDTSDGETPDKLKLFVLP